MTRMLLYTSPARGHLYPMMDVAIAMREAGHQVVVQTLADEREQVESAGVVHRPIAQAIEALQMDDYQVRGNLRQLQTCLECWASRAPHEVDDLHQAVSDIDADLLLVDANSWGAAAAAEVSGLPWAMFLPYCLPVPSPETPAFGPGFAPPRGAAGRLRDRLVFAVEDRAFRPYIDRLSDLRSDLGVPAMSSSTEVFTRAPLLLYRTAEPFEYPRSEWPANVRLIGPGLWSPPEAPPIGSSRCPVRGPLSACRRSSRKTVRSSIPRWKH